MPSGTSEQQYTVAWGEIERKYLQRARGMMMMGYYGFEDTLNIYGLYLEQITPEEELWDVFQMVEENGEEKAVYFDTLDVSKFASARDLRERIKSYHPDARNVRNIEPEDDEDTDDPEPSRTFQ